MVANKLRILRHDLRVYELMLRLQWRSTIQLRGAFWIQAFWVVLINFGMAAAWLPFFFAFEEVNGWGWKDYVGAFGISMLVFGTVTFLTAGIDELPDLVDEGGLDSMLTKPSPLLYQLAAYKMDPTTPADILLGTLTIIWYLIAEPAGFARFIIFLPALLVGMVVFWTFGMLMPNLLPFFMRGSQRVSFYAGMLIRDSTSSPTGVLTGAPRGFFLTVIPGLLTSAVPLRILSHFEWYGLLIGVAVAAMWMIVALWMFHRALLRYESGNLIGMR